MKIRIPGAVCVLTLLVLAQAAWAGPAPISTINGYYDQDLYDTPSLHFINSSGYDFTNVQMTLTGYQGINNGKTETVALPNITAGTTYIYTWMDGYTGVVAGDLTSYDYDDEYVNTFASQVGYGWNGSSLVLAPQCAPQADIYGWNYCAQVGNFYVTFTAQWNGQAIYSQFSPDPNLSGAGNAQGTFVGWEGLDQNGWSETTYDDHYSPVTGTLAYIYAGTPPPVGTPEPSSLMLLAAGLLSGIGAIRRKSA